MDEHRSPEAPELPEALPGEPALQYVQAAHPNDLIDPWWMSESLARSYPEYLYRQWLVDFEEVNPEVVDEHLPQGATLLRRGTLLNSAQVQAVFESKDALACIQLRRQFLWVGVSARDLGAGRALMEAVQAGFPKAVPKRPSDDQPRVGLSVWGMRDESRSHRSLEVASWEDIAHNYSPVTREALAPLMDPGFSPEGRGQLLVWHGPPGTGKSFALGALAYAWREWASVAYVADPESLLGATSYLMEFLLSRSHDDDRWRLAVLEDTGELFGANARNQVGQGLARLLNVTDGMLGKGSKTLFIITTNEPIRRFHEAVIRPGRCAARVEFEALPVEQAKAWLLERGAADVAKRLHRSATVAELFAMAAGDLEPSPPMAGGMYL